MVDAAQGILGIEWIDGRSVRFLLGGGEEDEIVEEGDYDEDEQEAVEEEDPLAEYNVNKGMQASPLCILRSFSFHRRSHADDWDRSRKNASLRHNTRRPHDI